jgi:hypothetical protein
MRYVEQNPKATVQTCHEHEPRHWVTEAAELGLPVGRFPDKIVTDLGDGTPFYFSRYDMNGDEIAGARYIQGRGGLGACSLLVIND